MLNGSSSPPQRFPEWERAVRPPRPLPPPKACDCQAHIFGDVARYPTQTGAAYVPPAASFDDLCAVERTLGAGDPACRFLVERLRDDPNWWVMLSNGNRLSAMDEGWDDAVPIARAYIEAAGDRVIWGSDWPHVQWRKRRMMNDGEVVEL